MTDEMLYTEKRLALIAARIGISLTQEEVSQLAHGLHGFEAWLPNPSLGAAVETTWEFGRPKDARAHGSRNVGADIVQTVERALSRAELAKSGGAYTFIDTEGAASAARRVTERERQGPLAGVAFAVKDMIAVAGRPIRAGSASRHEAPPESVDAPIVAALKALDAIFVGTTSLHEFAFGVTGVNDYAGTSLNPHDSDRIAGGSSSGSAVAVAERSATIAVGTDTGGSVRIPAALCGVVGFKPSLGSYPMAGVFPLSPTLDHLGFFAREVRDISRVHMALGFDVGEPMQPLQVGFVPADLAESSPAVRQRVQVALERLSSFSGSKLVELKWPPADEIMVISTIIMYAEAAAIHFGSLLANAAGYGEDVRKRLLQGLAVTGRAYVLAMQRRQQLQREITSIIANLDCMVGPTVGFVAPTLTEAKNPTVAAKLVRFTRVANLVGLPALSLPLPGPGLPIGLQIIASNNADTIRVSAFLGQLLNKDSHA